MITTPMWTGFTSALRLSSLMIGMKMMIAGIASMKSPTMMKSATSSSMIIIGSLPAAEAIQPETTAGPRR